MRGVVEFAVRRLFLLLAAWDASSGVHPAYAQQTELKTEFISQQTPSWCWAATAGMALEFLKFPDINPVRNYQCGVVAAAFPDCDDDCTRCDTTLDTMMSFVGVLKRYRALALHGKPVGLQRAFSPNYVAYPTYAHVRRSLNLSYPVIAGISADQRPLNPAEPQHAVLITGYDDDYQASGEPWVVVRDPYPYAAGDNPWVSAGYPYRQNSGRAMVPWRVLRDQLNLTSAVFLERLTADGGG